MVVCQARCETGPRPRGLLQDCLRYEGSVLRFRVSVEVPGACSVMHGFGLVSAQDHGKAPM